MRSLKNVSNKELLNQLKKLVRQEQKLTLNILPLWVEVERRGLYAAKHYCSLYEYCKGEFGYSDASAWRRAGAAIALFKCPEAWELLDSHRVSMTTLSKVSKIITSEMLARVCDKSQTEVDLIVAAYNPKSATPDKARVMLVPHTLDPCPGSQGHSSAGSNGESPGPSEPEGRGAKAAPTCTTKTSLRSEVELTDIKLSFEQKWKLEVVVSKAVHQKLHKCQRLRARGGPSTVNNLSPS